MQRPTQGVIPGRPHRPLVVRCGYDSSSRRVNFPSAATCRLDSLRTRIEECFALSAWQFYLSYTDDDGEEYAIRTEDDLTDAIAYFVTGDDETSVRAGTEGHGARLAFPAQKISMRVDVVVEYDGPSLSDASSILSFPSSESSWNSQVSGSTGRYSDGSGGSRSGRVSRTASHRSRDGASYASGSTLGSGSRASRHSTITLSSDVGPFADQVGTLRLDSPEHPSLRPPATAYSSDLSQRLARRMDGGVEEDPPPTLTSSELSSRWLREQSQLASRMPRLRRRYDSDNESLGSDDELGDIALVRDERGRYYYSYQQTDAASLFSRADADNASLTPSLRPISRLSIASGATASPPQTQHTELANGEHGPPILAPDCSACGVRLDHMRYVCVICGEGDMWTESAQRSPFIGEGEDSESSGSAWPARRALSTSSGASSADETVHDARQRSGSLSTTTSSGSLAASNGSATASPTGGVFEAPPRGYELCVNCIEHHGIKHARAARRRAKRAGELQHAFREKMWGSAGWIDVDYTEDLECTICRCALYRSRYKCVSCPKFDLCRSCYQKVEEIHPADIFLALPDKALPQGSARLQAPGPELLENSVLVRHPGAFCHNCLKDIVGPRFHCAVCPSWDLCIQCEGIGATGDGSHTADHIMMKIPIPLASAEVEAVSRRARDRWIQQDSAVAAAAPSSRSSSPTIDTETVYAPGPRVARPPTVSSNGSAPSIGSRTPLMARDNLDHNARCASCNEWIMGRRYQCANCPSDPEPYNLCSICELRSYRVHDPRHMFFKFDRPVHVPLQSSRPLLPPLYKGRVGQVPPTAVLNPRDPTAYLRHVLHRETLCDIHSDQIRGIWLRCAHCAGGFDICLDAEQVANHDPTHVFIVFKARVNMDVFRALANLGGEHPRPLLHKQVYLN